MNYYLMQLLDDGRIQFVTTEPMSHEKCMVMKSKFTNQSGIMPVAENDEKTLRRADQEYTTTLRVFFARGWITSAQYFLQAIMAYPEELAKSEVHKVVFGDELPGHQFRINGSVFIVKNAEEF